MRKKLGFAALATLLVLGSLELLARLGSKDAPSAEGTAMAPHPTRIWALEPGVQQSFGVQIRVSADGLREPVSIGLGAKNRVLTLGDSSIFGHGVQDGATLHDQLAKKLNERGILSEVMCGGVPGYSTAQTLVLMEELGWELDPAVLVIGNQFSDMNRDQFTDREVLERLASPASEAEFLLRYSQLYRRLLGVAARAKGIPEFAAVGWPNSDSSGNIRVPPKDYVENLELLLAGARERKIGVVFLQLDERDPQRGGENRSYAAMMESVAVAWGVPIIRAPHLYEQSGIPRQRLFLDEVHPTPLGNELMSQALTEVLLQAQFPKRVPLPRQARQGVVLVLEYRGPTQLSQQQQLFLNQR
jgi:lysophospholipase L1-like esterase